MSKEEKKVLLFALHDGDVAGLTCCTTLLKMKQLHNYHIHVTMTSQEEDFLSDMTVIQHLDRRFFLHPTDVIDDDSVKKTVENIIQREGKIDYLVCDMNQRCYESAAKNTPDFVTSLFEMNLYPHIRVITSVLPHMKSKNHGKVIVLNSYAGIQGLSYSSAYCSARFALNGFLQSVAAEVAVNKVFVSILHTAIRKPSEAITAHDGICFSNHQGLSDLDREFIRHIAGDLEHKKFYKRVPTLKLAQAVKNILVNFTDLHVHMNKSCKNAAYQKYLDPKGLNTLCEVSKFFLNVDFEECLPCIYEKKHGGKTLESFKEKRKNIVVGLKKSFSIAQDTPDG